MKNLLEIAEAVGVTGFLHCNEFHKLIELAAGKDVLEIGSFTGLSAYGMAWTAKSITCVDTFSAATDGQRQTGALTTLDAFRKATSRFNNVRVVVADSRDAILGISGGFDFVFIDAMHAYQDVLDDAIRWYPKLRRGGVMAFHDYRHSAFPGVERAVDELFGPPNMDVEITLRWILNERDLLNNASVGVSSG